MKPVGPRWEKVKQIAGDNQVDQAIGGDGLVGGAKEVFFFGQGLNWVLKIIQPQLFDYLRKLNYIPGTKEWAQRVKIVVENHLDFINENFPGIFPRTRVFLGQAETKSGKRVHVVNKLQEAISEDADPDSAGLSQMANLRTLIENNEALRRDFKVLYLGIKKLRSYGLVFDIGLNRNYRVTKVIENGKQRLKLYIIDSMPLFLTDAELFKKFFEAEWENGRDRTELITIQPHPFSKTFIESEEFFWILEGIFGDE